MARREVSRKFCCDVLPTRCFASFDEMRSEIQLCDFTLSLGKVSISAHRVILAAAIPYFRNIFSQNTDVVLDIEPNILACLIDYAYTYKININTDNVRSLLSAACLLGIDEVKEACCDFISIGLQPETASNVRNLAIKLNCSNLLEEADCYIRENFNAVSQTRDFLDYPLTYLKGLIDNDDLHVEEEKEVLDAVLRWVNGSPEDRKNDLRDLLRTVRLSLIEPQYLADIGKTEELIRTSSPCRDLIEEAKCYNLIPAMWKAVSSFNTQLRRNRKEEYVNQEQIENPCIYKLNVKEVYTVQRFDFLQEKWITENSKTPDEFRKSATHVQNKMYFFRLDSTLQYDPKDSSFRLMCSMPTYRECFGATALKNKIYICGGRAGHDQVTNAVECFDPAVDEWTTVKSMPTSRWGLSAVTLSEYSFAIGGIFNVTVFDTVEKYDPKRGKWTTISSMLVKRCLAGASTLNGRIYVCGGLSSNSAAVSSAEVYNPIDKCWTFISPVNSARYRFVLLTCHRKLYALKGLPKDKDVNTVEVYDPAKNEWKCVPSSEAEMAISGVSQHDDS